MPIFQDTIMITDDSHDHAVEVTVTVSKGLNIANVKGLAEQAWRSAKKEITVDGVTVKVPEARAVALYEGVSNATSEGIVAV